MRFFGPSEIVISTPQHALSDSNQALSVADSGFTNVLDGLQFGTTALAFTDAQSVTIPLQGAAPAVQIFRDCGGALNAFKLPQGHAPSTGIHTFSDTPKAA